MKHVWDCPNEWIQLDEAGYLNLPEHYAGDPDPDSPAYFINARSLEKVNAGFISEFNAECFYYIVINEDEVNE